MGCLRQLRDSEYLKSPYSHIKDDHALNSYLGILQPTSSFKPYILLSRNLMEGFRQHGDSEIAIIIPFAYKRLPSAKQTFWNSSTNILYLTIYPLEQKLGGRLHATWRLRSSLNHLFCISKLPGTEQPSWNSSNIIIFQTIYPLEQKLDGRQQAR